MVMQAVREREMNGFDCLMLVQMIAEMLAVMAEFIFSTIIIIIFILLNPLFDKIESFRLDFFFQRHLTNSPATNMADKPQIECRFIFQENSNK